MTDYTVDAVSETAGPISVGAGGGAVLCMSGTMTAGYVTVFFKPNGTDTYFPCDEIDTTKFAVVRNSAANGYGYCTAIEVPCSGQVKVVSDASAFAGSLSIFLGVKN